MIPCVEVVDGQDRQLATWTPFSAQLPRIGETVVITDPDTIEAIDLFGEPAGVRGEVVDVRHYPDAGEAVVELGTLTTEGESP